LRRFLVVAGIVLAVGIGATVAWRLDVRAHGDTALRHVTVAGTGVGGDHRDEIEAAVQRIADRYAETGVVLHTSKGDATFAAGELGLAVDIERSVQRVLDAGRDDTTPLPWLRSLVRGREAGVVVAIDRARTRRAVVERDPTDRRDPTEPRIDGDQAGRVAVVLGRDGVGIEAGHLADAVIAAAEHGEATLEVTLEPEPLHPRHTRAEAEALASRARALVTSPLHVRAGAEEADLPAATVRSWLSSTPDEDGLALALEQDETLEDLRKALPDAGTAPVDARFTVDGGAPSIVPGVDGTACCDATALGTILDAIQQPGSSPVSLPLRTVAPSTTSADLRTLGIVEQIATFTTRHKCCENRVQNIHRIADLVRGVVIAPGDTFSVNGFVGKRTVEKGFVVDHVIENGSFAEAVGGGISQFATTTFNAAFFGGLDLKEYQSHSLYISRYPYGREATLSYPKPDLVIGNSTPYGVLIWPTYTSTSLTVSLYSTRYATGEQTAQSQAPYGSNGCTRVTTERTRHFVDGTTKVDKVYAVYRPSEGVQCR
jgi:vancomycin resistance protein YoaR